MRVLLVDIGEEGEIPTRNIRVLHEPFTLLPSLALPCHLAEVCWTWLLLKASVSAS